MLLLSLCVALAAASPQCPPGASTLISRFELGTTQWSACEDIQNHDGAIALVSDSQTQWFSKTYEPYTQAQP